MVISEQRSEKPGGVCEIDSMGKIERGECFWERKENVPWHRSGA